MDRLTPRQRSRVMRAVKSKRTGPERRLEDALRRRGVGGWIRHARLPGSPDLAWRAARLAVFVHGCFWHACPKHYRAPKTSFRHGPTYWADKAARNRARDAAAVAALERKGWRAIVSWSHEPAKQAAARIQIALGRRQQP